MCPVRWLRPHLGLALLQQRLQPLLGGSALVVVADDQDDVVPPELPHQVEPHLGLVRVRRHGPQERQVDALEDRRGPTRDTPDEPIGPQGDSDGLKASQNF